MERFLEKIGNSVINWVSSAGRGTMLLRAIFVQTPYIWKTSNYGYTWVNIARDLDSEIYLKSVREDTKKQGLLYLGTERGVMVSHDDGTSWESLRLNMPTVAIADLAVAGDDLVVGSLGRAAYVLDDLTPLREMSSVKASDTAYLFKPLDAIRWIYGSGQEGGDSGSTSNPAPCCGASACETSSRSPGTPRCGSRTSSAATSRRCSSLVRAWSP